MAFVCIHIPDFAVQAVIRGEPASLSSPTGKFTGDLSGDPLRGRVLALVDGLASQCRVVALSAAAARAGVQIGMGKTQVEQFPAVEIRRRSPEQERNAHAALLDLGGSFSPRVEDTAPEAILLDLAGLEALFGDSETLARKLVQGAWDVSGLVAHVAVAPNPDAALHAARASAGKSRGVTVIAEGEEAARLGPLPIQVLCASTQALCASAQALGASAETLETLDRWGVRTCADLAALPVLDLSERLGAEGVQLHEWARGAGRRSLRLAEPALTFEETLPLDYDVAELEPLSFLLSRMLEALCARLEARALAASVLRLRLTLAPPHNIGKSGKSPDAYEKQLSLPIPLRNAKLLLNLLRLQLQNNPPGAPVRGIFLAAEPAGPRATQGGLFVPSGPDPEKLELTLAKLRNLVGESRVGSPQLVDTHRPDTFRMERFAVAAAERSVTKDKRQKPEHAERAARAKRKPQVAPKTGRPELPGEINRMPGPDAGDDIANKSHCTGFRMFRPPLPARVELREGRPARVFFRNLRGTVTAASGPWRSSGDWWEQEAWQQEEWDLEIAFSPQTSPEQSKKPKTQRGLYRIVYDELRRAWLVRGVYD
jgi:protein ImuB